MKISNSEVSTFLMCERRHYYAHGLNIMPNKYGMSLTRGIIGHEALEVYYRNKMNKLPEETCQMAALSIITEKFADAGADDMTMLNGLIQLLVDYWQQRAADDFDIIAVEEKMSMPLGGDDFEFAMRFDLLVHMNTGLYAGEVMLMDHKFVYNFWTPDDLMLNMQAPKYIATLRHNGIPVERMIINQLRWREVKSNPERFRREVIKPTGAETQRVLWEQAIASERIVEKMSDLNEYGRTALRTMNHMTCTNCSFAMLCRVELVGQDTTYLIATDFRPNDYGYNDKVAEEV